MLNLSSVGLLGFLKYIIIEAHIFGLVDTYFDRNKPTSKLLIFFEYEIPVSSHDLTNAEKK